MISYGQSENQKKLEAAYLEQYCACMGQDQSLAPEVILYKTSDACIIAFQKANADLINKIIREDYPENASMSEQDKRNDSGRRMVRNTIDDLVRSCDFYRNTLTKFKAGLMYQLGITQENARRKVQEMIEKEYTVKDPTKIPLYYAVLGVMHEFINDKKAALSYYDKALQKQELTAVKGLRELLILNGGFKPEPEAPGTKKL